MPGLRSLRNRLALIFALIIIGAIGTIYLSVTPRLEASLTAQRIDPGKRTAARHGDVVPTTYVEFEILTALARSPGRVFTRDMLLARVWGDSAYRDPRTIDVHIRHLREKIEADPKEPEYLFTVRGVGYRFRDEEG